MGHTVSSFPVGWSSPAPGAQGHLSFPHFPSPPRSALSLPSTPLHLPLIPSQSHPHLNPKEQLRSPRATVWVQFPSTWATIPLCVCSPDPSTEVLLQHLRTLDSKLSVSLFLKAPKQCTARRDTSLQGVNIPLHSWSSETVTSGSKWSSIYQATCLGATARQCRGSLNGKAEQSYSVATGAL